MTCDVASVTKAASVDWVVWPLRALVMSRGLNITFRLLAYFFLVF